MLGASLLFATMGVCVKLASELYPAGEIVFYRGLVGMFISWLVARAQRVGLRTTVPAMHFWRSLCGVLALGLWFYAIGGLPLATAVTLNYMSSVWMALFLLGGAVLLGSAQVDGRLFAAVLVGFAGVALVLRPTLAQDQLWHGLAGLLSGMVAAMAYLQVTALGRHGEPETRIVFYFALGGVLAGAASMLWTGLSRHTVGLLATAAQLMITRAFAIGSTLSNAGLQYSGILFAVLYGVLLFGERLSWMAVAGMLLIVGAGLASTLLARASGAAKPPSES
ncbi:MAG: DMT family transporter [Burkholderiaceae bacterium]|nr:DMT family transporter [Burkholderiaceae bacterium]